MQPQSATEIWSLPRKVWVLFFTVYFFFLICDFTTSDEFFPHFFYIIFRPITNFWNWIVPWTGEHILHLNYPITVRPNGSGDTTYNYVLKLVWIVMAILIAILITLLNRKRKNYSLLVYWLRIIVRYYLAFVLCIYGFAKVIQLQFPFPDLVRLTQTYGESSPMGLLWTAIGYSKGYNLFIGSAEVIGGLLLFFKRTTLFGSLIIMTVMINVAAMDFAYDVPVRIFCIDLILLAAWLAAYDGQRLINFFILNKNAPPALLTMPAQKRWKIILQHSFKIIVILFILYSTLCKSITTQKNKVPKPPLYGIYNVETFIKNADTLPPLTTDNTRFKQMIIDRPGKVFLKSMADTVRWYQLTTDTINRMATFTSYTDSSKKYIAKYEKLDKEHLSLSGNLPNFFSNDISKTDRIVITMKRFDETKFTLLNRKFNWIIEYPDKR